MDSWYCKDCDEVHQEGQTCAKPPLSAEVTGYPLLVARFRNMATVREQHALKDRNHGKINSAIQMESAAKAYLRCAEEVEAVIAGKTPPPVGEYWPEISRG